MTAPDRATAAVAHGPDAELLVLTGAPGVGKSTVARLVATRVARGAHVEADELQRFIVAGGEWPSAGTTESFNQLLLRTVNAVTVGGNLADAGFWTVVDEVIATREQIDILDATAAPAAIIVLVATEDAILERDAGRSKHTAANYRGIQDRIVGLLEHRATVIDITELTAEAAANAVVAAAGWRLARSTAGSVIS